MRDVAKQLDALNDRQFLELCDFADRALDAAIADAIRARVSDAEPAGVQSVQSDPESAALLPQSA